MSIRSWPLETNEQPTLNGKQLAVLRSEATERKLQQRSRPRKILPAPHSNVNRKLFLVISPVLGSRDPTFHLPVSFGRTLTGV